MIPEEDSELVELVRNLIQIETENPPGNERPCAEFIVDWFEENDISAKLVKEPDPQRPQVAARVGDGEPTVVLNGHIDVVPSGDPDGWEYGPYTATTEDGLLYGRGSADMKAGVAIGMLTTAALRDELEEGNLNGSVVFHAAMGEETGDPGTKTLLEMGYDGDYGVVLEPTNLRTATKTKGTAWYEITVEGDPSHASRPYQGTNAIAAAQLVYQRLVEFGEQVRNREDELLGEAYATVTEFHAGTKENIIPERAQLIVDRRVLPEKNFNEVHTEIDRLLSEVAAEHDIAVSWELMQTYQPSETPTDSHLANVFREISADIANVPTEPWGIPAATDTRNLVNDAGMEAITWGPGEPGQAHTFDEAVEISQVIESREILEQAVRKVLG